MPTYEYKCNECGVIEEIVHSIKESPLIECPYCKNKGKKVTMERLISLNKGGFIFKQWTEAQAYKIKRDRYNKSEELGKKQKERYGEGPKLVPNVGGEEVGSWEEAKKLAASKKLNTNTYDKFIEKNKLIK